MQLKALFFWTLRTNVANAYRWSPEPVEIPGCIGCNAPMVYLYSEERYYPGDPADYVPRFLLSTRETNFTDNLTLSTLTSTAKSFRQHLNSGGEESPLFLTARDQWEPAPGPDWLTKHKLNRPNLLNGKIKDAPATLIVVDKPELGYTDAFWFYFYPFNLGPFVMGHGPFGNHLGDWEHSVVRFDQNTREILGVWMSAHGGGTAYQYESIAAELDAFNQTRPVIFSARGTHAQYTSVGRHSHDIPWHMLSDYTDRGDLWDPAQNYMAYTLNLTTNELRPANGTVAGREVDRGDWLLFDGHWGNAQLDKTDSRQQWSPFEWRIIDGPLGPLFKNLERKPLCERSKWWNFARSCRVRSRLTAGEGLESEYSGCEVLIGKFPQFLQLPLRLLTRGGYLCFWTDRLMG